MPFRIAKTFTVESGHLLTKHQGACRFPHGHSRVIEIVMVSEQLDANDMVCDFHAIKACAMEVIALFDHTFALNTADPRYIEFLANYGDRVVPFTNVDPTSEVIAREIFHRISARLSEPGAAGSPLPNGVRLERVKVGETATSWAEYWE